MKKYLVISLFLINNICFQAIGQDSLRLADLQKFSFPFTLENGVFNGKGATVLTKAITNAHITMLGDNTRSKLESEFTDALISVLNQNKYKNIVLETGNASGAIINELVKKDSTAISAFHQLNQQYGIGKKENPLVPIPDFKTVEAGNFIQNAVDNNWTIRAIGTESWTSYKMLIDALFRNLSLTNQKVYQSLYQETVDLLNKQYSPLTKQNNEDVLAFTKNLKSSTVFNQFLGAMASFQQNKFIIEALKFSLDYWWMYGNREFFAKNKLQAQRNKRILAENLNNNSFDFKNDKLFIKMYISHLAKGTTVSGFYGVGNMLHELAEYHGHTSINIAIARRFYEENGIIKDIMATSNYKYVNFQELIPLGKKQEWILIDLRPFNQVFFWEGKRMSPAMHKIMTRYDLLIIPEKDVKGTINY